VKEYESYEKFIELKKLCADFPKAKSCPKCKKPVDCILEVAESEYHKVMGIILEFECVCKFKSGSRCSVAWKRDIETKIKEKEHFENQIFWLSGVLAAVKHMPWDPGYLEKKYLLEMKGNRDQIG